MVELLRRFWIPVLLSEELPEADGPPKKVVVMGEELLAFRDSCGVVGVIDQYCPHRGANLWLGRNEECGTRCFYHGWKFDTDGRCSARCAIEQRICDHLNWFDGRMLVQQIAFFGDAAC
jgi:phthalate 4,5-dioxygenase oxygenase subunit